MKRFRFVVSVLAVAALAVALVIGCEGKTGPAGPEGPAGQDGAAGPQGPAGPGTRTVYTGTIAADSTVKFISIPGLDMSDPPLVTSFVAITPPEFDELPFPADFTQPGGGTVTMVIYASVMDGGVTFYNAHGLEYLIIVIE